MRWRTEVLVLSCTLLGCSSSDGPAPARDAAADVQIAVSLPDLPPGCPPGAGNELGIGTPCTATGTECTGTLQCSCKNWFGYTMPGDMPCFCTTVTFGAPPTSCGSNAAPCAYDIPVNGTTIAIGACFPSVCLAGNQCPSIAP